MGWAHRETINKRIARNFFCSPDDERQFDSDLNAAFDVVAEMQRREVEIAIIHSSDDANWYVGFEMIEMVDAQQNIIRESITGAAQALSLPSAICGAALSYLYSEQFNADNPEVKS